MEGDVKWDGVSGVPGLGYSVKNCYKYSSVLQLWEEEKDEPGKEIEKKSSFSGTIVKLLSFRRKKSEKKNESSSLSLPKVSNSIPYEVKSWKQTKVKPRCSIGENVIIPNSKSNIEYCESCHTDIPSSKSTTKIRRSVSLQREKKKHKERASVPSESSKQSLRRSQTLNNSSTVTLPRLPLSPHSNGQFSHRKLLRTSLKQHEPAGTADKDKECVKKCQATQTDILEEVTADEEYDYVYSNQISPAMTIKLSEEKEDEDTNIYEEIIHQDKHNSLFFSISQGRREQLEMYRFAGWDLDLEINREKQIKKDSVINRGEEINVDKNNYINPQAIKSGLTKKALQRNKSLHSIKTKETKNVTFAADDDKKLLRSRSMKVSPP